MKSLELFWSLLNIFQSITIFLIIEFYFGASHKICFSHFKLRNCDTSLSFCDLFLRYTEPWSWEIWSTLYTFGACNKVALKILLLCLHILYYISKTDFVQMLCTYPFQLSKFTIGKLLQKYFCKKDTCDQNENIYIDWLVINLKFKLKKNCK